MNSAINSTSKLEVEHDDELIEKSTLALRLKVSTRTLDEWMRLGRIPFFKIGRKTVRFRWKDVLAHLERSSRVQ